MKTANEFSKMRVDGVYVQFGMKQDNIGGRMVSSCWYNMIRVVDDKTLLTFGYLNRPFWDFYSQKRHLSIDHRILISKSDIKDYGCDLFTYKVSECNNDLDDCKCVQFNRDYITDGYETFGSSQYDLYKFLGIYDKENVLEVIKTIYQIENAREKFKFGGYYLYYLETPVDPDSYNYTESHIFTKNKDDDACQVGCSDPVNGDDRENFYCKNDNYNVLYPTFYNTETCAVGISPIPYYFIPYDLSEPEIWKDVFTAWENHRKNHYKMMFDPSYYDEDTKEYVRVCDLCRADILPYELPVFYCNDVIDRDICETCAKKPVGIEYIKEYDLKLAPENKGVKSYLIDNSTELIE